MNFTKDLVSIIITNYNYSNYIEMAIKSALSQDYPLIQVIVVDDGSNDGSVDVIKNVSGSFELICKQNGGVSSARNAGMDVSKGEFIAFLDADDYWLANKISSQIYEMKKKKTQLNYCRMYHLDEENSSEWLSKESRTGCFQSYFLNYPAKTPFPPSAVVMSTELCRLVGDWDLSLKSAAEDYDFFRRASKYSEFSFTDSPLVVHREHPRSLTSGPLRDYFHYNHMAFVKAYIESKTESTSLINRTRRSKFLYLFMKSFLKQKEFHKAMKLFITIFQNEIKFLNLKVRD
jgi:glycosyltransferase involved in cell wall biosynthesis